MTLTSRCPLCNGKKQVFALGGMLKDCKECKGVGHVVVPVVVKAKSKKGE